MFCVSLCFNLHYGYCRKLVVIGFAHLCTSEFGLFFINKMVKLRRCRNLDRYLCSYYYDPLELIDYVSNTICIRKGLITTDRSTLLLFALILQFKLRRLRYLNSSLMQCIVWGWWWTSLFIMTNFETSSLLVLSLRYGIKWVPVNAHWLMVNGFTLCAFRCYYNRLHCLGFDVSVQLTVISLIEIFCYLSNINLY